jgi:dihydroxyacetone kinase
MSQFFLSSQEGLVPEAVEGLVMSSSSRLAPLEVPGGSNINIVVRADWNREKADTQVALISGGGSGHEPMHAGFVGEGMLTAAVCGGLFASPSIDAVLTAILHVAGKAGVLVIVKAYTGDCLNFGLAVNKAKALGISVEMVIFSDDIAIPDHPRPRGLAGVILLHKIAGYFAEQKRSLCDVRAIALQVSQSISTLGVSITSCSLPNATRSTRIPGGHAELGLGIHGEPGIEVLETQNVEEILKIMVSRLTAARKGPLAVLLNNLGGVSELEMSVIYRTFLKMSIDVKFIIGPARLCTSLDMKGFSLTFLELSSPDFEPALLAPVGVDAWVRPCVVNKEIVRIAPRNFDALRTSKFVASSNKDNENLVRLICETMIENKDELNRLDSLVGDGDTGTTFATGAQAVLNRLKDLPLNDVPGLFTNIGQILSESMGGSAGVLLAIGALQAGRALSEGKALSDSLLSGVNQMMELGGAKPGMRTMIDALLPAITAFNLGWSAMADAARAGAESTKNMEKAGAGRSSYLNAESLQGNADPGAVAIALVFEKLRIA